MSKVFLVLVLLCGSNTPEEYKVEVASWEECIVQASAIRGGNSIAYCIQFRGA